MSPTVVPGASSVVSVVWTGDVETSTAVTDRCEWPLRLQLLLTGTTKAVVVDATTPRRVTKIESNLIVCRRVAGCGC